MAKKKDAVKISAGSAKTLNALLDAANDFAFLGAAPPDDQDAIEARYNRQIHAMRALIARLEASA